MKTSLKLLLIISAFCSFSGFAFAEDGDDGHHHECKKPHTSFEVLVGGKKEKRCCLKLEGGVDALRNCPKHEEVGVMVGNAVHLECCIK
jgi:hypothetical protein